MIDQIGTDLHARAAVVCCPGRNDSHGIVGVGIVGADDEDTGVEGEAENLACFKLLHDQWAATTSSR
jgi:hypothetical protein